MLRGVTTSLPGEPPISAPASNRPSGPTRPGSSTFRRLVLIALTLVVLTAVGYVAGQGMGLLPRPHAPEAHNTASAAPESPVAAVVSMSDLPAYPTPGATSDVTRQLNVHTAHVDRPRVKVVTYTVVQGDTLFGIAEKYGLQPETILWGNYDLLKGSPDSIRMDQELNILPTDGTYYQWQEGDRIQAVADYFQVQPEDILDYPGNDVAGYTTVDEATIEPGSWLVIPGGKREVVTWQAPRITRANPGVARYVGPGACGSGYDGPVGEPSFIWPTTMKTISGNGYSSIHPAIDIAGAVGNAVYASASGVVVYAGWNDWGYGYMVVIDHGNGWQTLYAHLSSINVGCGQGVAQGKVIGAVGSTGNSTGPHLHFEMQSDLYGKVNPFNFVSP